jgi:hypothetical protein
VLIPVWVWAESRSRSPLVDMQMMRLRPVWTTNLAALVLGFGMFASFVLVPELSSCRGRPALASARR